MTLFRSAGGLVVRAVARRWLLSTVTCMPWVRVAVSPLGSFTRS
jgi:hypothetical protein